MTREEFFTIVDEIPEINVLIRSGIALPELLKEVAVYFFMNPLDMNYSDSSGYMKLMKNKMFRLFKETQKQLHHLKENGTLQFD